MVLSIINSVSVAIVFPKHNRVQQPHTASAPTVAWRPAVAFLRGEGRSAGFSETLNQYAYQNQHLVCTGSSNSCQRTTPVSCDKHGAFGSCVTNCVTNFF